MAAKIGQGTLGYVEKQSPGKEDVVECLKSTRKGKLTYGSYLQGGVSVSNEHGRSVKFDGDRLVICLSSSPDRRSLENIANLDNMTRSVVKNNDSDSRRIVKFHEKQDVKRNMSRPFDSRHTDNKPSKVEEKVHQRVSYTGLCISKGDVLDLVKDYRIVLEEKAKMEAKQMKQNFLLGLEQISDDTKLENKYIDEVMYAKHMSDISDLEESMMEAQSRSEEDLIKLSLRRKKHQMNVSKAMQVIAKKQEEIELEKQRMEEARLKTIALCESIESAIIGVRELTLEIIEQIQLHKTNAYLLNDIKSFDLMVKGIFEEVAKAGSKAISEQEKLAETLEFVERKLQTLKMMKEKVMEEVGRAEAKAREEEEKKELERRAEEVRVLEERKLIEEKRKEQETKAAALKQGASVVSSSSEASSMKLFVAPLAFEHYQEALKSHEELAASIAQFKKSNDKKSLRFDLMKVINTAINAISDYSPKHLLDKIERLTKLLNGDVIELGDKKISTAGDPDAHAYCKDTVAKKLVLQGAKQISSSFNSAFSFAAVALGIWAQFPDVGRLILFHFYLACPYLVPYYIPRKDGQSTKEYLKCLGYEVDGENVESEEKYQKKLSGIVRLYAAIVQSAMPPSLSSIPHPFGPHNAWTWLSRVSNLEPRETVTATILYDFLEVAGHVLSKNYGKQFKKLLQVLYEKIVPELDDITKPENKGTIVRLKLFLDKCVKNDSFPIPDGHISGRWWKNSGGPVNSF